MAGGGAGGSTARLAAGESGSPFTVTQDAAIGVAGYGVGKALNKHFYGAGVQAGTTRNVDALAVTSSRVLTIEEAAAKLAQQVGKNRVSIRTPTGQLHIDLAGKAHFDRQLQRSIPTPHVKFQKLNVGLDGRARLGPGNTRPATMNDVRIARKVIERRNEPPSEY